ncbi:HNH endonuclease signature motif containing protein [Quadrisphaera setariae]|uniref:DUF222 domain-containing protein n=1 Tax=Quadrisphaera setariae TaxID=2593304 RepID=A0A5C8ZEU0_9ACTN|nr:HNH endonuclease signature motif containing protein [Quadrisphaera setariae]TXR55436.1 DUF222 domain-containing protein [Quadrisphaera setariae]
MTWTSTEMPHEGTPGADGLDDGLGGGQRWQSEPLAPGALGAGPAPHHPEDDDTEPRPDLPPLPLTGPLAEALTAARAAADATVEAARYLASVGPHQRVQALALAAEVRHVTDAALLLLTASFTPEDLTVVGATSPTDLLITHTGAEARRASSDVRLAKALTAPVAPLPVPAGGPVPDGADGPADGPAGESTSGSASVLLAGEGLGRVGEQHARGRISTDIASLARRVVESLPRRIQRAHSAEADEVLARTLPGLTHPQAAIACEVLAQTLDPQRADRGFDPDDVDKRYLSLTLHDDGSLDIRGHLDAIVGAEFKAAIDHLSKPDPTVRAPLADPARASALDDTTGGTADAPLPGLDEGTTDDDGGGRTTARRGEPAVPVRDDRTAPQRRADALALLARLGRSADETRGGEPPRVIVTATGDQLVGVPGSGRATNETTRRPLTTTQLQHLACSALMHTVTLSCQGPDAAVLALGRAVRLFSPAQRRAMLARDGGCVIPGCTAPPGWLEAHHVHAWAEGGPTDVDFGVLLCGRHHVLVTLGVWGVRMVDGTPHVRPPASVDPLGRWLLNPRRAVAQTTRRRVEPGAPPAGGGLLLTTPPPAPPPPSAPDDDDLAGDDVPDIPAARRACGC